MASSSGSQRGEFLKNEGNTLHQKGQYRAAYRKYTEAIKEDLNNAIYYANRAACSLGLKEYMDAVSDAKKASELNPTYAKAWARLGTAKYSLSLWTDSIEAWKKAIACLPPQDQFTEADRRLLNQFTEGLQKAEKASSKATTPEMKSYGKGDKTPWQQAEAMLEQLRVRKKMSSGFVIHFAYQDFKKGVEKMKGLAQKPVASGQMAWVGNTGALVDISNGLMRDPRVFHLDCSDWFEKYNKQVMFENQVFGGWKDGGAKAVIQEAPNKLKQNGWKKTRGAIAITIRAWIICGHFATTTQKLMLAVEYHSRAVEVLDWGSHVWQDVPTEDRGCVFERTFIRGEKRLHIMAIHEAIAGKVKGCPYTKDKLADLCRDLIAETDANPPGISTELDAGFCLSFWVYPKAEALAILGWCHSQLGFEANDAESGCSEFGQAANFYLEACKCLPQDDEKVTAFLGAALEAYWFSNKPLKDVLFLIFWMQDTGVKMAQIWEHSPISAPRDACLLHAADFVVNSRNAISGGRATDDSVVKPLNVKQQDKWATPDVIYV